MITHFKRIISEQAVSAMEPALRALGDFVDKHGGEDLIRHLHAQDVEIVAHSNGGLLKCFRTEEKDTTQPEDCWRFWAGRYEIDPNHFDEQAGPMLGFTLGDYQLPVKYILDRTKEGKLDAIEPGTLIVVEVKKGDPDVRLHQDRPAASMVVVGVRYDVSEKGLTDLLTGTGDIEKQAIKLSSHWESHGQLQYVAELLGTDSVPLLFRGKLNTATQAVKGMEQSAEEDPVFRQILAGFLAQVGESPTSKDYERFFRHALRKFDDMQIRHLDKEGKVADSTLATKQTYQDIVQKLYRRYQDVDKEIEHTISQYGRDSEEHHDDYRDLNYLSAWLREQVGKYLFDGQNNDPISMAIHSLEEIKGDVTQDAVLKWVRRYLEEENVPTDLYGAHLKDANIPSDRHSGKNPLWEMFMREADRFISSRLSDVIADLT